MLCGCLGIFGRGYYCDSTNRAEVAAASEWRNRLERTRYSGCHSSKGLCIAANSAAEQHPKDPSSLPARSAPHDQINQNRMVSRKSSAVQGAIGLMRSGKNLQNKNPHPSNSLGAVR